MTEDSARKAATVVVAAAALGTAYLVLRNPPLRRMAWRLTVIALTRTGPAWIAREVQQAWRESAPVAG